MKILIDARLYGLENTGIGRYLINLIDELNKSESKDQYIILLRKKYFVQLNLSSNWEKVLADFRHYSLSEQLLLPLIINEQNPDLVHFPHFNVPILWNGKFVVTIHDMTMHKQGLNATKLPLPIYLLKRIPYKFVFRSAVSRSRTIITPTESVKKEIIDYFGTNPKKIITVKEGYSLSSHLMSKKEIEVKYKLNNPYFFYVGDLYPHKNIQKAIEAIKQLNDNRIDKVVFAVGSGRSYFSDRMQEYADLIKASEYVKFLGFVPEEDLRSLYKHSEGLLFPSLAEGFGLQGIEAMASGTVVLASKISVFKEVYGENCVYFDPNDVESISSAMNFVLNLDRDKRQLLINENNEFIKRYSWKKMAEETLFIYKALENNNSSSVE